MTSGSPWATHHFAERQCPQFRGCPVSEVCRPHGAAPSHAASLVLCLLFIWWHLLLFELSSRLPGLLSVELRPPWFPLMQSLHVPFTSLPTLCAVSPQGEEAPPKQGARTPAQMKVMPRTCTPAVSPSGLAPFLPRRNACRCELGKWLCDTCVP